MDNFNKDKIYLMTTIENKATFIKLNKVNANIDWTNTIQIPTIN